MSITRIENRQLLDSFVAWAKGMCSNNCLFTMIVLATTTKFPNDMNRDATAEHTQYSYELQRPNIRL